MLAGAVGLILLVRAYGETLQAPLPEAAPPGEAKVAASGDTLLHVLLALAAILVCGRVLGRLFALFNQPPVIGEIVAGILLGPSFLGRVAPEVYAYLLPHSVTPFLGMIAQLGVILYLFVVGLELNAGLLRERAHSTVAISHASIVLPFVLGVVLALDLYPRLSSSDVTFTSFALFLGVAMSITAFPVLARILTDRRLSHTRLGTVALTCAAADDVTAWCLLAVVVGVAKASVGQSLLVLAGTAAYIAFMFLVVRPLASRLAQRCETRLTQGQVVMVFVALLASTLATEFIGIHALFGAFLLGAVIPHDSLLARGLTRRLKDVVTVLFLPAFFALTGTRTEIGLLAGLEQWLVCGLIIFVAVLGKFGGTLAAARLSGLRWRDASALGVLMNTRGLMELIVLNVGLELKVISPTLFAMMVLMAIVTTMATSPILQWLIPRPAPRGGSDRRARATGLFRMSALPEPPGRQRP